MESTATRLTAEQAEKLWRAWSTNGDDRARDRLVLSYTPMVNYIASRKVRELPAHCELDDLVSCGLIALLESVSRFDPTRGATFEQYAWVRVSGAIMDELRRQDWAPRSLRRLGRRIDRTSETLYARNGCAPADEDVAFELEISVAELRRAREELEQAELVSLNARARTADESVALEVGDTVEAAPGDGDPERSTLKRERVAHMRSAVRNLSDRERQVLTLVHGHELSGAEVGSTLGVTESRVSQIMNGVRTKLRSNLDDYDFDSAA